MPCDPAPAGPRRVDERAVNSVLRAIDMVEERMDEEIGVQDMARAACFSPFYFTRLFVRATGHAPYDYLMRRRVAAAAEEVARGTGSITEIALAHGFPVPDTFARAFRRCFGMLPSDVRREGAYPRLVARTRILRAFVEAMLADGAPLPEAEDSAGAILVGTWCAGPVAAARALAPAATGGEQRMILVERDGDLDATRAFVGTAARPEDARGVAVPAYPLCTTRLAAGPRARFRVSGRPGGLPFLLEFAYRSWLPAAGRRKAPCFDVIEADRKGELSLVLPLE